MALYIHMICTSCEVECSDVIQPPSILQDCKAEDYEVDLKFDRFKQELQELLVVHAYKIDLKNFRKIYHQRYARDLDLQFLGVDSLDALFPKVVYRYPVLWKGLIRHGQR